MSRKVKIRVTKDDIKNGLCLSGGRCPVALAVKRALPQIEAVCVTTYLISWIHDNVEWNIDLKASESGWIQDFDTYGREFKDHKPISFTLDPKDARRYV